jgi:hypothetical protein
MDLPLWEALERTARKQGTTASEVLRTYAVSYVNRYRKGKTKV